MTKKKRITSILAALDDVYGDIGRCYLNFDPARNWQLLLATILSAQCTDDRVNIVTTYLFDKYPSLQDFAAAPIEELEEAVRSTGFYRNKALGLKGCAQIILDKHGGELPSDIGALTAMPGVGRKTANVVRGHIFGIPSIVVDTHVKRVTNKLDISAETDPEKLEFVLMKLLPKSHWIRYNTQLIAHGRKICKARAPECDGCFLHDLCDAAKKSSLTKNTQ
ncbi:MAG: endonuclease III [Defluviitaleaceae bacterium]|nr:endonuclease III [Defluviitaleaceae bacterium]